MGGTARFPTTFERSGIPAAAAGVSRFVAVGHGAFVGEPRLRQATPWQSLENFHRTGQVGNRPVPYHI